MHLCSREVHSRSVTMDLRSEVLFRPRSDAPDAGKSVTERRNDESDHMRVRCYVRAMRAPLFYRSLAGVMWATALAACGAEPRERFSNVDEEAGVEPSPTGYSDAGAAADPCDPSSLAERGGSAGCRFLMTASTWIPGDSWVPRGCYALVVSNPSDTPARLRLRFKSRTAADAREEDAAPYARRTVFNGRGVEYLPLEDGLVSPAETVVVSALFLPFLPSEAWIDSNSRCPTAGFVESTDPAARDELVSAAIELVSDTPILVTQISAYAPAALERDTAPISAFSLFPVHLWEEQPVETGIFKPGLPAALPAIDAPSAVWPGRTFALAAFDDTHVLLPTLDGPARAITLQRGEVFSHTTNDALAGRPVIADKPVGLVTFAPMTLIDWEYSQPFLGHDMSRSYSVALPSSLWGSEYVAARHANRWEELAEAPLWRILGGADGTLLEYDPYRPEGAPERVGRGELVVFFADAPFSVRSQDDAHPFYFSESMTGPLHQLDVHGVDISGEPDLRGGALTVHQLPTSRWHRRYPFFAPLDFPSHSVVLVRPRGGPDVVLDCAGTVTGWTPVGERFEYARVPLTGHLYEPVVYPAGTCEAGPHWIESEGPFSGTLWGWGNQETAVVLDKLSPAAYALPLLGADRVQPRSSGN